MQQRHTGDPLTVAYIPSSQLEPLITIKEGDGLIVARTEMELGDFSQLPVMRGKRAIGVVSWQSIGRAMASNPDSCLEDCLDRDFPRVRLDTDLFEAISVVNNHGYVLVTGPMDHILGIITSADLGEALADLAHPFLYFERLEDSLRKVFDLLREHGLLSNVDVTRALPKGARDPSSMAENFTLGDLVTVLTDEIVWARVTLTFDRKRFQRSLHAATSARNRIMHFRKLSPADERTVRLLPSLVRLSIGVGADLTRRLSD